MMDLQERCNQAATLLVEVIEKIYYELNLVPVIIKKEEEDGKWIDAPYIFDASDIVYIEKEEDAPVSD